MIEWDQQPSEMSNRQLLVWLGLGLVGILSPALQLWEARAMSWLFVGGGIFIPTVVGSETAANTQSGQYIDAWWRRIGMAGRSLAILTFAVVMWGSIALYSGSLVPLSSFVCGLFLGLIIKPTTLLVRRRFNN